jgi:hypothetical protein
MSTHGSILQTLALDHREVRERLRERRLSRSKGVLCLMKHNHVELSRHEWSALLGLLNKSITADFTIVCANILLLQQGKHAWPRIRALRSPSEKEPLLA